MTTEMEYLFKREYRWACDEVSRLNSLFKDVCWYNFETECRSWKYPWRQTELDSQIDMIGMVFDTQPFRETASFPVWYAGPIRHAPSLPPQIVVEEQRLARAYREKCRVQLTACEDWAPGGSKYEQLCKTTLVGKTFSSA
jgi:hypothetical protein